MIQCWKIQNKDFTLRESDKRYCDLTLKYPFIDKNIFITYSEFYQGIGRNLMQIAPVSENRITLYSDEPFDNYNFEIAQYCGIYLTLIGFWK